MATRAFKPEPATLPVTEESDSELDCTGNCEERTALLGTYSIAASFSAQCSLHFQSKSADCTKIESEQMRHHAAGARSELDVAFDELEHHVAERGCSSERSHHVSRGHVAQEERLENSS